MDDRIDAYLREVDSLQGWLAPTTGFAMAALLKWQTGRGETGGIAEIGIHHGKSFLAMAIGAEPEDRLLAIDCFDDQEANYDRSGEGDLAMFRENLTRWAPDRNVEIIARDSAEVRHELDGLGVRDLRFFSVDGSHTKAMTRNDLEIADRALKAHGLCVLDDFLNPWWTGVTSGFFDYSTRNHGLQPVALLPNKLLLARPHRVAACRAFLREAIPEMVLVREAELADGTIDLYGEYKPEEAPWAIRAAPSE